MRERPIGDLVTGLKQLGADVDCFLGTNCPPVRVIGKGGLPGGKVRLRCLIQPSCIKWFLCDEYPLNYLLFHCFPFKQTVLF